MSKTSELRVWVRTGVVAFVAGAVFVLLMGNDRAALVMRTVLLWAADAMVWLGNLIWAWAS